MTTVARRLKCTWRTAKKYTDRWEATRIAVSDENETILDLAESVLYEAIQTERDRECSKWILSRKGRNRGYGESLELGGEVKGQLIIVRYGDSNKDQNGTPA